MNLFRLFSGQLRLPALLLISSKVTLVDQLFLDGFDVFWVSVVDFRLNGIKVAEVFFRDLNLFGHVFDGIPHLLVALEVFLGIAAEGRGLGQV